MISPVRLYVGTRPGALLKQFVDTTGFGVDPKFPLATLKERFLAMENTDTVADQLAREPLSRIRAGKSNEGTAISSVYDPGNALYAAYLMKLCFQFADLSGNSSERLGDVVETVCGLCFLVARFPKLFDEKVLGDNFKGLGKLHAVLSRFLQIFIGSLSQITEACPNSKRCTHHGTLFGDDPCNAETIARLQGLARELTRVDEVDRGRLPMDRVFAPAPDDDFFQRKVVAAAIAEYAKISDACSQGIQSCREGLALELH